MSEAEVAVEGSLVEAARGGERLVSALRLVFSVLVSVRAIEFWTSGEIPGDNVAYRALVTLPPVALAIAFSIAILAGAWRQHTRRVVHISAAIDAVVAFFALLPNALWPPPHYQGVVYLMDTTALFLVTMATGLRHTPSAVVLGGALNTTSFCALVAVDLVVSGEALPPFRTHVTMYAILMVSTTAIAFVIARRTRTLVEIAARASTASVLASRGLRRVLHEHHDLRSVLSSAQLKADLVAAGESEAVAQLRKDLLEARDQLDQLKARSLAEVARVDGVSAVSVERAVGDVFSVTRARYPEIELAGMGDLACEVLVAGGELTLRRVLANLVNNACEGDGRRAARSVVVRARHDGDRVSLEVVDDGPGLPPHVLHATPADAITTKVLGTGLGMGLVEDLVRVSGGSVTWANRDEGGARVTIELRFAGSRAIAVKSGRPLAIE